MHVQGASVCRLSAKEFVKTVNIICGDVRCTYILVSFNTINNKATPSLLSLFNPSCSGDSVP